MIAPEFLDLEDVLQIQTLQLDEFGGIAGLRDRGLLESAVEQPRTTAFGELLHADLFEMAAAYLFHIVKNHAFLDGNKRTALVAALVFLDINGVSLERDDDRLYELTMAAAEGRADKQQLAGQLRKLADESQT
ncbi:MAG TPA: type II toxin-antitoxin system death-on-curing family toxin [Polyangiaceae bacterium]|nr:type II toxin-antitoxin system death-on-curing family toxin [Polyangiaceae bacterium]